MSGPSSDDIARWATAVIVMGISLALVVFLIGVVVILLRSWAH